MAQHTTALAHRLAGRGARVEVLSWSRPYPRLLYPGQLTVDRPEITPFEPVDRCLAWSRPDTWVAAGRRVRDHDLAVFAHVVPAQAVPYRVAMTALGDRARVAVICHNVLPHESHRGDRRLVRSLLGRADRVLVHSAAQAAVAAEVTGGDGTGIVAADLPPFFPDAFAPRRPAAGVHHRLLFFGIVRPYKGLDVLLQALADGPPDVTLRVAGEVWGGTERWHRRCAELGIGGRVEFLTHYIDAADVPALFADVDALVLPYREATGSQAVWVGSQFGVPVIASRAGALADAVTPGVDGLVVEPGDAAGLAGAIAELYRPGRAEGLRAQVRPVDPGPLWDTYLDRLLDGLVGPSGSW